jgi:hypothetical protein
MGSRRFTKATEVDFVEQSLRNQFPQRRLQWRYGEHVNHVNESWLAFLQGRRSSARFLELSLEDVWAALLRGTEQNRLMSGTIAKSTTSQEETKEGDGLFGGHAYSILQAREISTLNRICVEKITVTYTSREEWLRCFFHENEVVVTIEA